MFSIIIPTFNRRSTLERALRSLYNQTDLDFEIIVVDDGSTDGTELLFKDMNTKIRYEKLASNHGVHVARNKGIDLSRGEYIIFLDADDEFLWEAIEETKKIFENYSDVGIVISPYRTSSGDLTSFNKNESGFLEYEEVLCEKNIRKIKGGLTAIRKSIIGETRFVMQNLDFIFFRKLARKTKVYFIAKPLGIYHLGTNNSLSKKRKIGNPHLSIKRGIIIASFLEEFEDDLIKYCPKKYSYYAYGAAAGLLLARRKKEAIHYAYLAKKYQKNNKRYALFYIFARLPFSSSLFWSLFTIRGLSENKK